MDARDLVTRFELAQGRLREPAFIGRKIAARREAAAGRRVDQPWHDAGDGLQAGLADGRLVDARDRADQALGIGMARIGEQLPDRGFLHHLARIHHHDALRDLGDDAHGVGDQHDRHAEAGFHVLQEIEDLRLDRDIERRRRLVGDQELRTARQRHRDHHALAHAAGKLMRIVVDAALRIRDLNQRQHVDGSLQHGAAAQALMQRDHLADLVADGVDGIERGHRLLEHDGDFPGANPVHLVRRQRNEVAALPQDLSAGDASGRHRDQLQDRQRRDGLAAAGLADDAHRLAAADGEIDAIHRLHDAVVGGEMRLESPDIEQRGFAGRLHVEVHHVSRGRIA